MVCCVQFLSLYLERDVINADACRQVFPSTKKEISSLNGN